MKSIELVVYVKKKSFKVPCNTEPNRFSVNEQTAVDLSSDGIILDDKSTTNHLSREDLRAPPSRVTVSYRVKNSITMYVRVQIVLVKHISSLLSPSFFDSP